jgi:hypothetical protein
MNYPFNTGDLICCGQCAANYVDANAKVPWGDLRYIFGEIMYGGHIVEDWDRRLAAAHLNKYFNEALLEGGELFPGFPVPPPASTPAQVLTILEWFLVLTQTRLNCSLLSFYSQLLAVHLYMYINKKNCCQCRRPRTHAHHRQNWLRAARGANASA